MQLKTVKLTEIKRAENSRPDDFDCSELMESIKESGIIQPLVVARNFYNKKEPFVLVAGNRRYSALSKLGIKTTEAVINDNVKNEADLLIFNMSENLQRSDVSSFEQGRLVNLLIKKHKFTVRECSVRLGVGQLKVRAMLDSFNQLPSKFSKLVVFNKRKHDNGKIALKTAKLVATLKKSNLVQAKEVSEILENVVDGTYNHCHVMNISNEIRDGSTLKQIKEGIKKVVYISIRLPIYLSEREEIQGNTNNFIEQLVYGESSKHFRRPKYTMIK